MRAQRKASKTVRSSTPFSHATPYCEIVDDEAEIRIEYSDGKSVRFRMTAAQAMNVSHRIGEVGQELWDKVTREFMKGRTQ